MKARESNCETRKATKADYSAAGAHQAHMYIFGLSSYMAEKAVKNITVRSTVYNNNKSD